MKTINESCTLTCVYCGHEYPQGTPSSGSEILTEHIKVCAKHPMRELEEENKRLRKTIEDLKKNSKCSE